MFVTLRLRCREGHEWDVLLANYWFELGTCPTCKEAATELKCGDLLTWEQLRDRMKMHEEAAWEEVRQSGIEGDR